MNNITEIIIKYENDTEQVFKAGPGLSRRLNAFVGLKKWEDEEGWQNAKPNGARALVYIEGDNPLAEEISNHIERKIHTKG